MENIGNRFIFPAPEPSYGAQSYKRHLCWIPWNDVISPQKGGDGRTLEGIPCLWFPAPKAATVILFFHANAEDLGMSFAVLKHMRDQFKVNVLAVEYPGYGLLNGMTASEDGVYEVALTAFRFLVDEINVRYSQIILFGRSLGTGPAVHLAAQYPVGGLILVSAFSSIRGAVQSIVGRLFAWTFTERFPNSRIIANVSCSTLFIHGERDGLIPADHSLRLFKRCRARKLLITPPRMEHNSNLFGDASFLAVPAIHFFGFPGYYTSSPPRLPTSLFETPERRARLRDQAPEEHSVLSPWLCGCLAKGDQRKLDPSFCRQEQSVEDIAVMFPDCPAETQPLDAKNAELGTVKRSLGSVSGPARSTMPLGERPPESVIGVSQRPADKNIFKMQARAADVLEMDARQMGAPSDEPEGRDDDGSLANESTWNEAETHNVPATLSS